MEIQRQTGFTLIELMIALVIAGILLGVGIPSFSQAMMNSRMSANINMVAQALYIARSEAVKGSEQITVCPRAEGEIDGCSTSGDWTKGLLVFVDNNPTNNGGLATLGANDIVVHSQAELSKGSTLSAVYSTDRTQTSAQNSLMLRYRPTGQTDWANGYFLLCDDERGAEDSMVLNIVPTGDIRRGRPAGPDTRIPLDVFGRKITC